MNNLNEARAWASEQTNLELLNLRTRGRLARRNGSWANWSSLARLMWLAAEETA